MKLSELYSKNRYRCKKNILYPESEAGRVKALDKGNENLPVISIEIFPPKGENAKDFNTKKEKLFDELRILNKCYKPSLVSITYGAGGSSRERSNIIVKELMENFDFNVVMPHFTCVCSDKNFIGNYLDEIKTYGVKNILALKGDEPDDIEVCHRDFRFAYELVEFIKSKTELEIAVAGYPEGHIGAKSLDEDIKHLKTKINKGANAIFTQFFFENEKFYNYIEKLEKNKICLPVAAGLLPVISYDGLMRMVKLSGITLSRKALNHFEKYKDSKEDTIKAGIEWTSIQAEDLICNGAADGIHFYALNKACSTGEILKNIGLC